MSDTYFLYILKNEVRSRHYIGIFGDPTKRLSQHNGGHTLSTKPYRPWRLALTQTFPSKKEARIREIFLKKTARARKDIFDKIDRAGHGLLCI